MEAHQRLRTCRGGGGSQPPHRQAPVSDEPNCAPDSGSNVSKFPGFLCIFAGSAKRFAVHMLRLFGPKFRPNTEYRTHFHELSANRAAMRAPAPRSEEHTSELQSLMRISYAVFCLKKKTKKYNA